MLRNKQTRYTIFVSVLICIELYLPQAQAIPTFARAYNVGCNTCHTAVSRRNEFGKAFRRAGYRWPTVFADAIPPEERKGIETIGTGKQDGWVPNTFPFSVSTNSSISYNTSQAASEATSLGSPSIKLLFGTTFGKDLSILGNWTGSGPPSELFFQMGHTQEESSIHFRAGRFEQWHASYKNNSTLLTPYNVLNTSITGHVMGTSKLGLEANGVFKKRWFWSAGMVQNNQSGAFYNPYYQLSYKFGGLDFLGEAKDIDFDAQPSPIEDLSLTVAQWGYFGNVSNASGIATGRLKRLGLDLRADYRSWSLWTSWMVGEDDDFSEAPLLINQSVTGFVELDHRFFSWLTALYLFEHHDQTSLRDRIHTHNIGVIFLLYENFKVTLMYNTSDVSSNDDHITLQLFAAF